MKISKINNQQVKAMPIQIVIITLRSQAKIKNQYNNSNWYWVSIAAPKLWPISAANNRSSRKGIIERTTRGAG